MEKWKWTRHFRLIFTATSMLIVWLVTCSSQVTAASSRQQLQELLAAGYGQNDSANEPKESNEGGIRWSHHNGSKFHHTTADPLKSFSTKQNAVQSYEEFYRLFYGPKEGGQLAKQHSALGYSEAKAKYTSPMALDAVRQANEHFLHIRKTARCHTPRAKVIRVQEYYPDPTKEYIPRCTILHRCGDDSGCCDSGDSVCAPRASQEVVLHFYTFSLGGKQSSDRGYSNAVEKLLFENHTQCECRPINNMPRMKVESGDSALQEEPTRKRCPECPYPFNQRHFEDGRCSCDCFDKQRRCLRIKRGRDSLSEKERRCVQAGYCHVPDCEYGHYDSISGKCPKRHEESEATRPDQFDFGYPPHRWTYLERD